MEESRIVNHEVQEQQIATQNWEQEQYQLPQPVRQILAAYASCVDDEMVAALINNVAQKNYAQAQELDSLKARVQAMD